MRDALKAAKEALFAVSFDPAIDGLSSETRSAVSNALAKAVASLVVDDGADAALAAPADERVAFEAWADGRGLILAKVYGHYGYADTARAWESWQARSRLSAPADVAEDAHDELSRDDDGDITIDYSNEAGMLSMSFSASGTLSWAIQSVSCREHGADSISPAAHAILSAALAAQPAPEPAEPVATTHDIVSKALADFRAATGNSRGDEYAGMRFAIEQDRARYLRELYAAGMLSAAPPRPAPVALLSEEEIVDVLKSCDKEDHTQEGWIWRQRIKWARAIEAAVRRRLAGE